jgi:NAD(P)-dependent dehydrogenase (short-subunit alcohol dehydrogenase family)
MLIDLLSTVSVVSFAEKFKASGDRLDYLILNAGIGAGKFELSPDGYESTYVPALSVSRRISRVNIF